MNNIEEKIKELIWKHALKIIFTFGFIVGVIVGGLFL